jgi:23S rRNA (guanine745-N1)-methyltransferase
LRGRSPLSRYDGGIVSVLPLSCPVRGCGLPLDRHDRQFACRAGHSFDVARSGYLNLLQSTDRRSPDAGDTRAAVEARARLAQAGIGAAVLEAIVAQVGTLALGDGAVVADLGSGAGDGLEAVARAHAITAIGIDLSTAAATLASRRFPHLTWIVANADRRLPLLDGSVALVLSQHARRNPRECARIVPAGGHLLITVPAPDDLVELRAAVQGRRVERDRAEAVIAEHAPLFRLTWREAARERRQLSGTHLRDLLHGTYRGVRASQAPQVEALESLDVTLASDVLRFVRR